MYTQRLTVIEIIITAQRLTLFIQYVMDTQWTATCVQYVYSGMFCCNRGIACVMRYDVFS